MVLEVNGNPSWQGILEATGLDMAEVIAEHVLGRALRRRRSSDHIVLEKEHGGDPWLTRRRAAARGR